eukprot:366240-Chlamydomonas_euryale.AAC.13
MSWGAVRLSGCRQSERHMSTGGTRAGWIGECAGQFGSVSYLVYFLPSPNYGIYVRAICSNVWIGRCGLLGSFPQLGCNQCTVDSDDDLHLKDSVPKGAAAT